MLRSPVLAVSVLALLGSCVQPTIQRKKLDELMAPGFIDVGAGYAVAFNTRAMDNDDADGLLLSVKAYPFGRWYGKPRSNSAQALAKASRVLVEKEIAKRPVVETAMVAEARRHVAMALGKLEIGSLDEVGEACQTCISKATTSLKGLGSEERSVERALLDLAAADARLVSGEKDEVEKSLKSAQTELEARSEALQQVENDIADAINRLASAQGDLLNEEFYEVEVSEEGHDSTWSRLARRFSIFYGTSVNEFGGGGLESNVNAIGLGFDVAPQLSILVGYGFYRVDDGAGTDTDGGLVAAVSLNLNAFRWMFGSLSN